MKNMSKTSMQIALAKVLASMKMSDETKVLIALSLTKDTQIGTFLQWLKSEIPEEKIQSIEEEIAGKATEISRRM